MPRKDPILRKQWQNDWSKRKVSEGYGKALYARRKQRFDNEQIFRQAIEEVLGLIAGFPKDAVKIKQILEQALEAAPPPGKPMYYMPEKGEEMAVGENDDPLLQEIARRMAGGQGNGTAAHTPAPETIERILTLTEEGLSQNKIAGILNDEGVPGLGGKGKWYQKAVSQVLHTHKLRTTIKGD